MQESFGKQNVQVLLLSVDERHGRRADRELLENRKLDWPNVLLPGGWEGAMRTFNCDGYGLIVVDATGNVRGADLYSGDLVELVEQLWVEQSVMRAQRRAKQGGARSDRH